MKGERGRSEDRGDGGRRTEDGGQRAEDGGWVIGFVVLGI